MQKRPIGIFDSGVGGLSILRTVVEELPNENIVYFADSKHCPYGDKSQKEIQSLAYSIVQFLLERHHIKLMLVACNTATVAGIQYLRQCFPQIPFVGVVPVIKPACQLSAKKRIGCLATEVTVKSQAQATLIKDFADDTTVYNIACIGLVDLIEQGMLASDHTIKILKQYLQPLIEKDIDVLALGCTHYPFLRTEIEKLIPPDIEILDSGKPVAKQVRRILAQNDLLLEKGKPWYRFLVNGDTSCFDRVAGHLLNGLFNKSEQALI